MPSARINIEGQLGANRRIKISRTKPSLLNQHMNNVTWHDFCNKIDGVLLHINNFRSIETIFQITTWHMTIASILAIVLTLFPLIFLLKWFGLIILLAIIGMTFFLPCILMIPLKWYKLVRTEQILDSLKHVCDDENRQHSRLTFIVQSQPYPSSNSYSRSFFSEITYIEVTICNDSLEIKAETTTPVSIAHLISPKYSEYDLEAQT